MKTQTESIQIVMIREQLDKMKGWFISMEDKDNILKEIRKNDLWPYDARRYQYVEDAKNVITTYDAASPEDLVKIVQNFKEKEEKYKNVF